MNRSLFAVTASALVSLALFSGCGEKKGDPGGYPAVPIPAHSDWSLGNGAHWHSVDPQAAAALSGAFQREFERIYGQSGENDGTGEAASPDPAVFATLRAELERQLAEAKRPSREGRAPVGMAGKVRYLRYGLVEGAGGGVPGLEWTYTNSGDYNLDGEVTVADITPIALHFGKSLFDLSLPSSERETVRYVDGDESGIVDVGDITPIAINFDSQLKRYVVQGSDSPDGPFIDAAQLTVVFKAEDSVSQNTYLSVPISLPYKYYVVVPIDGLGNRGEPSYPAPNGNAGGEYLAPSIVSVSGNSGNEGDTIALSAEVERSEGATYIWYLGGAGSPSYSNLPILSIVLRERGVYLARLTVSAKYGIDIREFRIGVFRPTVISDDCIWIDTVDTFPDRRVVFDVYAHKLLSSLAGYLEIEIAFPDRITTDDVDLVKYTPLDASLAKELQSPLQEWICSEDFVAESLYNVAVSDGYKLVLRTYLNASPGISERIASFAFPAIASGGIEPNEVVIRLFDDSGMTIVDNWAGRFDWETTTGFRGKGGLGFGGEPLLPNAGTNATFNPSANSVELLVWSWLAGDTDGDNVVCALDFNPIALFYSRSSDDGDGDEFDIRADADGSGEVGVSDFSPIALHHHRSLGDYDQFHIFRDGELLDQIGADPVAARESNFRPVQFQSYSDPTPTPGEHTYTVRAYNSETGEYGPESKGAVVIIPEPA